MNVLIACEESQRVCIAFRERGHTAFSCDIQTQSGGHPEWHIQGDCLPIINGNCAFITENGEEHIIHGEWDLLIAHPPCTYLSNAGSRHLYPRGLLNYDRYLKGLEAKEFFLQFYNANCPKICIENPVPSKCFLLPPYTQIIEPFYFGVPFKKKTCLWLKNLPNLKPTNIVNAQSTKTADWFNKGGKERQKNRSKTFPEIARTMAEQWG